MDKEKMRNSKIEILRILSMFLIVLSHYTFHNGINNFKLPIGFNRFLLEFSTLGNIGVILFVMISGYFLINKKELKLDYIKIFKLLLQIIFYSITIYLILNSLGMIKFNTMELVKNIFPITFKRYWFATAYFITYLFSPFINNLLNNLKKEEHLKLNILMIIIFSILKTITNQDYYGTELIEFLMFYSFGAYIRKYLTKPDKHQRKINYILLITSIIMIAISIVLFDIIGEKISIIGKHSNYFLGRTSPLSIIVAITIFNTFIWHKPTYNKIINKFSSSMFGVYLISDNKYIRKYLWTKWLKVPNYINSNILILHMILSVLIVIIICSIIDLIRIKLLEQPIFNKMTYYFNKKETRLKK